MPSHNSYADASSFPAFPTTVEKAELPKLSLARLVAGDAEECDALWSAARTHGFFLVDMLDDAALGSAMLSAVDPVFALAQRVFALPEPEKREYALSPGRAGFGYKGFGVTKVDAAGTPDQCEFWAVAKDDVLNAGTAAGAPRSNPPILTDAAPQLAAFARAAHAVAMLVCDRLDAPLGLPRGALVARQRLDEPSGDQVRLLHYPPRAADAPRQASLLAHSDLGAVTVLFSTVVGLQVLAPGGDAGGEAAWAYVQPQPGCAIVNLGDAMVMWTNGAVRSAVHRVAAPPGEQLGLRRYSVAYFAKPEYDATMAPLGPSRLIEGLAGEVQGEPGMTMREWEKKKAIGYRVGSGLVKT